MFKHILVPTDGSELSRAAADGALALARALGARITGVHVVPSRPLGLLEAWVHGSRDSAARLLALQKKSARRFLDDIAVRARSAGVACECRLVAGEQVFEEIIKLARKRRCDVIYMASHGRKGTADVILGSETVKVLTHSPIPVLVHRTRESAGAARRTARRRR